MDPDTLITLDDGTEVTLADLMQSRKDLKDALEINDTLQKDLEEVGTLFQANVQPDRRETAVRNILQNLGYEDDQIEGYISAARQHSQPQQAPEDPDDEVEEIDLPDLEDDTDETSGGPYEDSMSDQEQLKQELEAQRAELHRMRVRELRENLNANLDRVLKSNPEIQKLIESARSSRGDEGVNQATQTLRAQLEQRALERMQSRRAAAGTFEDSWMSEEVDKATEPVLGTFRSVIGDIDKLGRSSETVTGFDAQEILRSKPAPDPEYKPGATISDIESQVKSFTSDTIKRALATSPGESAI
jgi:small-conductance mechanosensitive channel